MTDPPFRPAENHVLETVSEVEVPLAQDAVYGWSSGAAVLCGLTGAGELVVVQQQLEHGIGYVLPYVIAAVLQFALARWLWTSEGSLAPLVGVGTLSVLIGSYVVATANGIAVGPHGEPAQADVIRTAVTIGQLCTMALLLASLRGRRRRWAFNAVLLGGVLLWTLRLSGVLG